jgi:hypothetical protein
LCIETINGAGQQASAQPLPAAGPGKYVDKDGTIHLPRGYRMNWTHLGTWSVDGKDGSKNMHDVYAEPDAVNAFRKTGKWPEGATIVKEIRDAQTGKMTTGNVRWDGPILKWFVMVRDNNHMFPDNPNWGRGWGWGLYDVHDPNKNISTDYKTDCIGCHIPAEHTDWVYTQGYPTLHETENKGSKSTGASD